MPLPSSSIERVRASTYRRLHTGNPGDVAFYLEACSGAETVLELGVGWGRIACPLADAGHTVTGVDTDRGLLEMARQECPSAVNLVMADMVTVDLPQRFERVIIPYNGLFAMASLDAIGETLANAKRHLTPGGELIFDVYVVDAEDCETDAVETSEFELIAQLEDGTIEVFERDQLVGEPGRIDVTYRLQSPSGAVVGTLEMTHRFVTPTQIMALLLEVGFTRIAALGGFEGQPFDGDSDHLVIRASSPSPLGAARAAE